MNTLHIPKISSKTLFYDWENPDQEVLEKLPEWLREIVSQGKSQPKRKIVESKPVPEKTASDEDEFNDDIPF